MKRLSIIMSGILAVLFFMTVFFSMGNDNYRQLFDFNAFFKSVDYSKEEGIQIFLDENEIDNVELQKFMYDVFEKYHVTAIAKVPNYGTDLQKDILYLYSEKDVLKDQVYTKNDERIDFSGKQDKYYTIDKNAKNGVLIDFLNPMFYDLSTPFEIHPFYQAIGHRMPFYYNILGINEDDFNMEIKKSGLDKYLKEIQPLTSEIIIIASPQEGIQFNANHLMSVCIGLVFVALMLIINVEVVKNKKYIAVAKLNGISRSRIILKIFVPYVLSVFLSFSIIILGVLFMVSGPYRAVNRELYKIMLLSILGFFMVMVMILVLLYAYLWTSLNFHDLKQNKMNVLSIQLNVLMKIVMTSVLILPFVNLTADSYTQFQTTKEMYQMKKESEHLYVINQFVSGKKLDEDTLRKKIQTVLAPYHPKAFDSSAWRLRYNSSIQDGDEINPYEVPVVIVNRNYLKDYEITKDDKKINVEDLKNGALLVPKDHENSLSQETYERDLLCNQVITIDNLKVQLKSLYYAENVFVNESIKNPFIYIYDETNSDTFRWGTAMYLDLDNLDQLSKDLKDNNLEDSVTVYSLYPAVKQEYNKQLTTFSSMAFMMCGYLSVYLTFIYQSIYVYLDVYRKKLSVQYLLGYSYFRRYIEIYVINACAYVLAGIGAYMIFHATVKSIILYILFFGGMELLFEAYQIHRFEKKSAIRSLK